MKSFTYLIQDEMGIHARPAGLLVKTAKQFQSTIMLVICGSQRREHPAGPADCADEHGG